MNALDRLLVKVETVASQPGRLMTLATALLDKIAPTANAAAGSCLVGCTLCNRGLKHSCYRWCAYCSGSYHTGCSLCGIPPGYCYASKFWPGCETCECCINNC
jgi:hypothetical protein